MKLEEPYTPDDEGQLSTSDEGLPPLQVFRAGFRKLGSPTRRDRADELRDEATGVWAPAGDGRIVPGTCLPLAEARILSCIRSFAKGQRPVIEHGWPFGPYPPGGLRRLGPHVVAYHGDAYPVANSAIVGSSEATLVFDANLLRFARALRAAVDQGEGPPLRELVLSHTHNDHAHGAMHFSPPARTWASHYARDRLAYWAGRDLTPFIEELVAEQRILGVIDPSAEAEYREVRIVVPDRVVDAAGETIELGGGVRVRLHPEATAHTPGDLWAFVEPDGIALCGDLWFNDCEPYIASGSLAGSLNALSHLRESGARTWLPGHGAAGSMRGPGEDAMERYCRWVGDTVQADLTRGLRGADLQAEVRRAWNAQREGRLPIRFALEIPGFLEDNVEMVQAELSSEPSPP